MTDVVYFKAFIAAFVTPRIPNQKLIALLHKHVIQMMFCLHPHFVALVYVDFCAPAARKQTPCSSETLSVYPTLYGIKRQNCL
jgi:hypothetical protein